MSTVLWANQLYDGKVMSAQSDLYALYKHTRKLDRLCKKLGLSALSTMCDDTDMRLNFMTEMELPEGMTSTDELMARDGVWVDAAVAVDVLSKLLAHIQATREKFGLLRNDHDNVVAELKESLVVAEAATGNSAKFNFAIVG